MTASTRLRFDVVVGGGEVGARGGRCRRRRSRRHCSFLDDNDDDVENLRVVANGGVGGGSGERSGSVPSSSSSPSSPFRRSTLLVSATMFLLLCSCMMDVASCRRPRDRQQEVVIDSDVDPLSGSMEPGVVSTTADDKDDYEQDEGDVDVDVDVDVDEVTADCLSKKLTESFSTGTGSIAVSLHRHGESAPCADADAGLSITAESLARVGAAGIVDREECLSPPENDQEEGGEVHVDAVNKYQLEAMLTALMKSQLQSGQCGPVTYGSGTGGGPRKTNSFKKRIKRGLDSLMSLSSSAGEEGDGFLHFCDMGPNKTVIQYDHDDLVELPQSETLPCRFYTREGVRITSVSQLAELSGANTETGGSPIHLYAVPAGRVFMFAPSYVGEVFDLPHVSDASGNPLSLEVLSVEPRVFDIRHFFSRDESKALIDKAVRETSSTHKLHRSTTGTSGASIFSKRTSENAWDTHGTLSMEIKDRCFRLLGFDEYTESHADGLQILRYNLTTAYVPHMDYLTNDASEAYDYDSGGKGGNRFATILLYMSDLPENAGGETVFPKAWPNDVEPRHRVPFQTGLSQFRQSGDAANVLKEGSWEETMAVKCRTRLAVKPNASRAVLFYSQHPDGTEDTMSEHGGCPVLDGTKWAANLWVWSAPRPEFAGAPFKKDPALVAPSPTAPRQISAVFHNTGKDPKFDATTELYYDENGFFGKLGPTDPPLYINTYQDHRWDIKVDGKILKSFVIGEDERQEFRV